MIEDNNLLVDLYSSIVANPNWYADKPKIKKTRLYHRYRALLSQAKSLETQVELNRERIYQFEQKNMMKIINK